MIKLPASKSRLILPAVSLAILFALASCASQEAETNGGAAARQEAAPDPASPEIRLGTDLLRSIRDGDYGSFSRTLAGKTGFDIGREDFESSCAGVAEKYGRPVSWSHLAELEDPVAGQHVWKVHFVKNGSEGKPVERDMLFRLACARIGEKTSVLAFGFF